jgi:hypothetical protein
MSRLFEYIVEFFTFTSYYFILKLKIMADDNNQDQPQVEQSTHPPPPPPPPKLPAFPNSEQSDYSKHSYNSDGSASIKLNDE